MKRKIILLVTVFVLLVQYSCNKDEKNNINLKGDIKYGKGDCMPTFDQTQKDHNKNYSGLVFFIIQKDLEDLYTGLSQTNSLEELKANSMSTTVKKGNLAVSLPEGAYIIMPEQDFSLSDADELYSITINQSKTVQNQNFNFWFCTSH